jgi:hypothetical protein
VALVRTDIWEERIGSIKVKRMSELGTLAVTASLILFILMMEATRSSETTVRTGAIPYHIPEDGILHSHRHENLRSYKCKIMCETVINKKQTPLSLVRKRTIPTDDRHLLAKFSANFCG